MISIIVCSRHSTLSDIFKSNIANTVGVDYELICIDNSKNTYSLFSAYNEGRRLSQYPYLCFVHDDVLFHTHNWGDKLIAHLDVSNTGLVGLAGGDGALRTPFDYGAFNRSMNIIHVDINGVKPAEYALFPKDYKQPSRSVVMLDGVLLGAKSEVFSKICFDESIGGFHGYDYDISIQSIVAGYFNYVMYDISLVHFSKGNMNAAYFMAMLKVFKKWENFLPIIEHSVSDKIKQKQIPIIEQRNLYKLIKKLARTGFATKEIIIIAGYYSDKIKSKKATNNPIFLRLTILFIRISSFIRKKNVY
jgi:hypothetical protein